VYLFCGSFAYIRHEITAMSKEEDRQVKQALLVEDHVLFREGLALLLSWRTDLDCVEAGSLAEGHQVLSDPKGTADIAIISVDLPDGDGCELIERLHKTKPDVPVLALATDRSRTRQARALEMGADEVLSRATPVEQIIASVERIRHR
jgi:DNA-binding NarL/FixJ family response regulator